MLVELNLGESREQRTKVDVYYLVNRQQTDFSTVEVAIVASVGDTLLPRALPSTTKGRRREKRDYNRNLEKSLNVIFF